jgi:hypothetical protein
MGSTDIALIVSPEVWTIQNILAPFIGLHDETHHSGDHQQKYACFEKCHLMRAPCFCSCGVSISINFLKTGSGIRSHSEFRRYCPFTLMGRTRCGTKISTVFAAASSSAADDRQRWRHCNLCRWDGWRCGDPRTIIETLMVAHRCAKCDRHVERVFNPERKEHHWGRRKLARAVDDGYLPIAS